MRQIEDEGIYLYQMFVSKESNALQLPIHWDKFPKFPLVVYGAGDHYWSLVPRIRTPALVPNQPLDENPIVEKKRQLTIAEGLGLYRVDPHNCGRQPG